MKTLTTIGGKDLETKLYVGYVPLQRECLIARSPEATLQTVDHQLSDNYKYLSAVRGDD